MGISLGNRNSGRRRTVQARLFSEINITPMVDVMLVLLVIFMVTAPMMTTGVTVELPKSKAPAVSGQDEPLIISVTADGRIFVQKAQVPIKDLQAKLRAVGGEKKDMRIFVRGDKTIDYGRIMQVVGEIAAAGFTKIGFVTDPTSTLSGDRDR